jgi:uncharacterized protein YdhG (YjbR/CyaY superfamily)
MPKPKTFNDYIKPFPPQVRSVLKEIRQTVRQAAPDAEETIKYGMPTYVQNGNVVSFGAYKTHIGFYPTVAEFKKEQAPYMAAKSTLQFPLDKPMPLVLIRKVTKARVKDLKGKGNKGY